ncbi:hypothetical protein [Kitasatospora sp. NPDC051914]|uniref:hypothetical protein n=1 Tax=Kitasatospora sp. NPDC051914 TaxID=3154945 RepID=UPI00343B6C9A
MTRALIALGSGAAWGTVVSCAWALRHKGGDAEPADRPAPRPARVPYPERGEWDRLAYWDPMPTLAELTASIGDATWEQRSWLNAPGPFYCGETDTGLNGPFHLPEHILSDDEGYEFVYRQPADPREVDALVGVAYNEPLGGYASDGDQHWTPESVRAWWADRGRVLDWLATELEHPEDSHNEEEPLRAYAARLQDGTVEDYLRGYLFWLIEGREPLLGEALPDLAGDGTEDDRHRPDPVGALRAPDRPAG